MFASINISQPNDTTMNSGNQQRTCYETEIKKDYSRHKKVKEVPLSIKVAYVIDDKLLEAVERIPSYGVRVSSI